MFFIGCDNNKEDQKKLQKQVIDKHDVLMARMDLILQNKRKLDSISQNMNTLKIKNASLDTTILKQKIDSAKAALTIADEAMMDGCIILIRITQENLINK